MIVALCDNKHQRIVPVSPAFGNGQDPRSNLYWGARYGIRTHFLRTSGYQLVRQDHRLREGVLERIVLAKTLNRSGKPLELYVVAEAWDGRLISQSIQRFLDLAAGAAGEVIRVGTRPPQVELAAGGQAAVVAYVGHNGLMHFKLSNLPEAKPDAAPRSSIVLACASRPYFLEALHLGGSHPLLLTTGLMAPEAYTLDAALTAFAKGASVSTVHDAAARAYAAYQKCGLRAARALFHAEP